MAHRGWINESIGHDEAAGEEAQTRKTDWGSSWASISGVSWGGSSNAHIRDRTQRNVRDRSKRRWFFSLEAVSIIENSTSTPHVTILATVGPSDTFDYFQFTVTTPGEHIFDIDYGSLADAVDGSQSSTTEGEFDSFLRLFDAQNTFIAFGDDSAPDPGSVSEFDSFLSIILLPGLYSVEISSGSGPGIGSGGFDSLR